MTVSAPVSAPAVSPGSPPVVASPPPIPFLRLLRVEFRKATDTRAARWLLALVGLVGAGAVLAPLLLPSDLDQTYGSYVSSSLTGATLLLPVIAILATTAEWSQRSVLVTFTQEPRRGRVVGAKLIAGLLLGLLCAAFCAAVGALGLLVSSALGRSVEWGFGAEGWKVPVGMVAAVLVTMLMAMAFGILLQNTPAAIVLYFVLPTAWSFVSMVPATRDVAAWINTGETFQQLQAGVWDNWTKILVSIGVWVVVPLIAGLIRTQRREVS